MAARDINRLVQTTANLRRFSYGPRPATLQQVVNAGYITENQPITITGDATGSGTTTIALELTDTGVSPGSYTNTNLTVDVDGRIIAASNGSEIALPVVVTNGGTGVASLPAPAGVAPGYFLGRALLSGAGTGVVAADPVWGGYDPGDGGLVGATSNAVAGASCYIEFGRSLGTPGAPAALASGTRIGSIQFDGYANAAWQYARAEMKCEATEAWTASAQGTRLFFQTTIPGAATTSFQMGLLNGCILGAPTGSYKGTGTLNATIVHANGAVLTSDERLKRDIEALPACLPLVQAVEPVSFRWRPLADPAGGPPDFAERQRWGFLAQGLRGTAAHEAGEVEGLDVGGLIAILWQALRETTARLDALEAR